MLRKIAYSICREIITRQSFVVWYVYLQITFSELSRNLPVGPALLSSTQNSLKYSKMIRDQREFLSCSNTLLFKCIKQYKNCNAYNSLQIRKALSSLFMKTPDIIFILLKNKKEAFQTFSSMKCWLLKTIWT